MEQLQICLAQTPEAIDRVYVVMRELRPHLSPEEFRAQVQRQQLQGYKLACLEHAGEIRAVAGFRLTEMLAWGKFLYVDDLVTCAQDHGQGFGSSLFDWLVDHARENGCTQFHLDSGVHRFGAHRFYLHKGLDITCHHFAMKI